MHFLIEERVSHLQISVTPITQNVVEDVYVLYASLTRAATASPVSPASSLLKRAGGGFDPDCPKQASGTCVFSLSYTQSLASDGTYICGIYDSTCTGTTDFGDCNPAGGPDDQTVLYGNGLVHSLRVDSRGGVSDQMGAIIVETETELSYSETSPGVTRRPDCSEGGFDVCSVLYIPYPCS